MRRRLIQRAKKATKRTLVSALANHGIYRVSTGSPDFATQGNTREALDAFYSDCDAVDDYLAPSRLAFYRVVADIVAQHRPVTGADIADVGCGTGHLLALFDDASRRVGFDFSEAALGLAREVCPAADFVQLDINDPVDDRFDIVLCCEVLEHLFHPGRAVQNVARMAGPDGLVVLTVPNGRVDTFLGHINFWSPESWQVFLAEYLPGFAIETGVLDQQNLCAVLARTQ